MKIRSVILSALFVTGAFVGLENCGNKNQGQGAAAGGAAAVNGGSKIAFVNIDSLEEHYELLKSKRADFKKQQEQMEGELQASYQQMQQKAEGVQKRAQSQSITESEYKSAEKELMLMQQSLESRKQSLTDKLLKQQEEFSKELKRNLDAYLESYNKDKHYDFILSYSANGGSPIMYANKQYEITKDVIAGMNATSKGEGKK
jgi:outer membrane protein